MWSVSNNGTASLGCCCCWSCCVTLSRSGRLSRSPPRPAVPLWCPPEGYRTGPSGCPGSNRCSPSSLSWRAPRWGSLHVAFGSPRGCAGGRTPYPGRGVLAKLRRDKVRRTHPAPNLKTVIINHKQCKNWVLGYVEHGEFLCEMFGWHLLAAISYFFLQMTGFKNPQ